MEEGNIFFFVLFKLPALLAGLGNGVAVHADCSVRWKQEIVESE